MGNACGNVESRPASDPSPSKAQKSAPKSKKVPLVGGFVCFTPNNRGTLEMIYSKDGPPPNTTPCFLFEEGPDSKIPGRKYEGRATTAIASDFGAQSANFFKQLLTTFPEAKRQNCSIRLLDATTLPVPFRLHFNLSDDSVISLSKSGDVLDAETLKKVRAVTVAAPSLATYDKIKRMAGNIFEIPVPTASGASLRL